MKIIIETKRLYLREFNSQDATHFYEINKDPDVIKYTGDTPFKSITDAKMFLDNYNQYKLYGMGRWAVCLKEDHTFLGWCGLKYHPDKKIVEVGFRFYKKYWSMGYATESAQACLEYGFKTLKLKQIFAQAHIDNYASHKVIENCNMTWVKEFDYEGMPAHLYKLDNPYFKIKKIKALETYAVRHPVLREGRPLEDCKFDHDEDDTTFHLGLFFENDLIGVVSYMKTEHNTLQGNQYQLRGMAVLKPYQNKGLGKLLIDKGDSIVRDLKGTIIWCNAREIAVNFYKRNGFEIFGEPFIIPKIGLHYSMYKKL